MTKAIHAHSKDQMLIQPVKTSWALLRLYKQFLHEELQGHAPSYPKDLLASLPPKHVNYIVFPPFNAINLKLPKFVNQIIIKPWQKLSFFSFKIQLILVSIHKRHP